MCMSAQQTKYIYFKYIFVFFSSSRNVVVTQPGKSVWEFEHPWSHKLCSCFTDVKQCKYYLYNYKIDLFRDYFFSGCFAFFCPCCFECELYERAGESMWTCMCPGAGFALRSKIRTAFRIEVSILFCVINLKKRNYSI